MADVTPRLDKLKELLNDLVSNEGVFDLGISLLSNILGIKKDSISIGDDTTSKFSDDVFEGLPDNLKKYVITKKNIRLAGIVNPSNIDKIIEGEDVINTSHEAHQSFLLFIIKLDHRKVLKKDLAALTRKVNQIIPAPSFILFHYTEDDKESNISLAFVDQYESDMSKYPVVVKKVTMLHNINCHRPSRGHLDIISDLSLKELFSNVKKSDRNDPYQIIKQSLRVLDIDELNNKFYKELYDWYTSAINNPDVIFPCKYQYKELRGIESEVVNKEISKEEQLLRLIIRFMFVWFIKEKGLVPNCFFEEDKIFIPDGGEQTEIFKENKRIGKLENVPVKPLLKYSSVHGRDNYYKVIMQNLFFATLNNPMEERNFHSKKDGKINKLTQWHYKDLLSDPSEFQQIMNQVPFVNGGLFDCLDKHNDNGIEYYLDCFSEDPKIMKEISIPNSLFFGKKGLIELFNNYKFTVEENTPSDIDVALDPELLGRVFEKLIAYYNPETRESGKPDDNKNSRKSTGSFFTKRHIVDYMVIRSLKEYLKSYFRQSNDKISDKHIDELLNPDQTDLSISEKQQDKLLSAIDSLKIIDPAVGSGAFPMEILRHCVAMISKLDPDNKKWKKKQWQKIPQLETLINDYKLAERISDTEAKQKAQEILKEREKELEDNFNQLDHDYLRKLYLIRNSIYGVDIQPIACQLAKLRFFISLTIDQKINDNKPNRGIQALPNLETRFVAADSLIKLSNLNYSDLETDLTRLEDIKQQLKLVRDQIFTTSHQSEKRRLIDKDKQLREQLEVVRQETYGLVKDDNTKGNREVWNMIDSLGKIASHEIMDQNLVANWFDTEWFFGISKGFDIIIGNPPYISLEGELGTKYKAMGYNSFAGRGDIYCLFYEKGINLLKEGGILAFITSNKWIRNNYGVGLRVFFQNNTEPLWLLDLGPKMFKAAVDTNIFIVSKNKITSDEFSFPAYNLASHDERYKDLFDAVEKAEERCISFDLRGEYKPHLKVIRKKIVPKSQWLLLTPQEKKLKMKIDGLGTRLIETEIKITRGYITGCDDAFMIDKDTKRSLIESDPSSADLIKPVLEGRDIRKWHLESEHKYIIHTHNGYRDNGNIIPPIDIDSFPAIKKHLDQYKQRLQDRKNKGKTYYNLMICAFVSDFYKEKIVYAEIVQNSRFHYDTQSYYLHASAFMIIGKDLKFLLGILNSNITHHIFSKFYAGVTLGDKAARYKPTYLNELPIPIGIPASEKQKIESLVDEIIPLTRKRVGLDHAKINKIQEKIDKLVTKAYQLTDEDIQILKSTN